MHSPNIIEGDLMIEKLRIHVPERYEMHLLPWKKTGISFNVNLGDVVAYEFISGTQEYTDFLLQVEKLTIPYEIFSRNYSFSKKEKESSLALRLIVDGNADSSESEETPYETCLYCGKRIRKSFRRGVCVNKKYIQKYDLSISHIPNSEIFISDRLKTILEENNIVGYSTSKVYDIKTKQEIEGYYILQTEIGIGEVIKPTLVEQGTYCPHCNTYDVNLRKGLLYFDKQTWSNHDICYTKDMFGTCDAIRCSAGRDIIISQRLYRLLTTNKIRLFSVEPVFLI
jgi:hypothetical protein